MGKKKLNYEICKSKALNCKDRKEFWNKESKAALLSKKNGWIDEWFPEIGRKERGYWTKKRCIEESKKYSTRSEFDKKCRGAYSASNKNGWLDEFTWLEDNRVNVNKEKIDCVYRYFFKETNSVYVGRTIQKKLRDWSHIFDVKKDAVAKYAYNNGFKVPEMEILENNLTLKEGQKREKYWIEYYKKNGYNILNKAVGGSLGSILKGKWNYFTTYNEAKKYNNLSEFRENSSGAYNASKKNNWIYDYKWLTVKNISKQRIIHDFIKKEECFEKAKNCKTLSEFATKYHKYYLASKHFGWINEFIWFKTHKPNNYWTYEKCIEIAKKYKTKKEFHKDYPYLYEISQKNKWLETYTWLLQKNKPNGYWTYEKCYEEAKKYKTFNEFKRNESGAAYRARVNGWVKNYDWFNLKNK
jgi:hypothetical protein